MVKALLKIRWHLTRENEGDENNLLRVQNDRGNTALHEALLNGPKWNPISECLIREDPELAYYLNKNGESALYLSAKDGNYNCVTLILSLSTDENRLNEMLKMKKSPFNAAIKWQRTSVLHYIFHKKRIFFESRDGKGRTPLHYAASLGYYEFVPFLEEEFPASTFQRDKSGSLPIHLAAMKGSVGVIRLLLKGFPNPSELLDREGLNILHISAKNGKSNVVSLVLKNPALEVYINMKDKYGNTPLHLATMYWHPEIVHTLTWDKRVNVKVVNDDGLSALDVAEQNMSNISPFYERLTWAALESAGTPRYQSAKTSNRKKSFNTNNYKERVNTLLLVSILVVTVTFAAGFTMPGGYNSLGMAMLLKEKGFQIFVLCDAIAMLTSIVVSAMLIWAQLGDVALAINVITVAIPLLGFALGTMTIAFTAGIFVVVSRCKWLATVALTMGATFLFLVFILVLLLYTSLTSKNWLLRYLSYYLFRLMVLAVTV